MSNWTEPLQIGNTRRPRRGRDVGTESVAPERQLELSWTEPSVDEHTDDEDLDESRGHSTSIDDGDRQQAATVLARRAYPLAYDTEGPAAPAMSILAAAANEGEKLIAAYHAADVQDVGSRLSIIAALMMKAYPHTAFNPALGATVSFVRRAAGRPACKSC